MNGLSVEDGIGQVYNGLRHVVILGAGASIASTIRNPELNGKALPHMDNFIAVVGLEDIIQQVPENLRAGNFEKLYGNLHKTDPNSDLIKEIEARINLYFGDMQLPPEPTIYDYLVMSLRGKDLVATFNWDPFLYQALLRNREFTSDLPSLSFLHGNVAVGYTIKGVIGPAGYTAHSGDLFESTKLLYPVDQKNYNNDQFIREEWRTLETWLKQDNGTVRATIFGYGAPVSDVEAVALLNTAWGTSDERYMEQFEVIDITQEALLRERWDGFIHSHHYDVTTSYFRSSLAKNPRRSCESFESHYRPTRPSEAFRKNNPVPENFSTLEELWAWHESLIAAEKAAEEKSK